MEVRVMRGAWQVVLAGAALAGGSACAAAQSAQVAALEQKVFASKDATIRLTFATKPNVCGNGDRNISIHGDDDEDGWKSDCDHGPAHVTIKVRDGELADIATRVGGSWLPREGMTDLGTIGAKDASQLFLRLARRPGKGADDAILPAIIADSSDNWKELLSLARNDQVRRDVRKSAVFWVGQEAAAAATRGLTDVVDDNSVDREVRESAVFALSQRPKNEAVPALVSIARNHKDPEIRRKAIFWLGQTEDPRALAYFEEVLTR